MNQFDKLTDDLVVKIFGTLEYHSLDDIESLRLTCKRFCHVINHKMPSHLVKSNDPRDCSMFSTISTKRIGDRSRGDPYRDREYSSDHHVDYLKCKCRTDADPCKKLRKIANLEFVKCTCLRLECLDLKQSCILRTFQNEKSNLETIVKLRLFRCKFDLYTLDAMLACLPSLMYLRLNEYTQDLQMKPGRPLKWVNPDNRVLFELKFKLIEEDRPLAESKALFDYLLENFQAHYTTLDIEGNQYPNGKLELYRIKRYLRKIGKGSFNFFNMTTSGFWSVTATRFARRR